MSEVYKQYSLYSSGLHQISGTIATAKVHIKQIIATNGSGDDLYLQLFNTGSSSPTAGVVPVRSYRVAKSGTLILEWASAREFTSGANFAWSSAYKTLATGQYTSQSIDVEYNLHG